MCLDSKCVLFVKLSSRSGRQGSRLEQENRKKAVLDHETVMIEGSNSGQIDGGKKRGGKEGRVGEPRSGGWENDPQVNRFPEQCNVIY